MRPTAKTERELADLHPDLERRVRALIEACPYRIGITSAWRSREEQQRLYDGWKARKPGFNPANPPGMSKHEDTGPNGEPASNAADLAYASMQALAWAHEHAREFGLHFPIRRENWHVESNGKPYQPPTVHQEDEPMSFICDDGVKTYLRDGGDTIHIPAEKDVNALIALGAKDGRGRLSPEMVRRLVEAAKQ